MAIRSVCLVAAVVASGPLRWTLVAGAVLLPYFAVVVANAGRARQTTSRPESVLPFETSALESGPIAVDDGSSWVPPKDHARAAGGDAPNDAPSRG